MEWRIEEDKICCAVCVEEYVRAKKETEIGDCIEKIKTHREMANREDSSIRMRIQNIKSLLDKYEIPNSLKISPLSNASKQTEEALLCALSENK